MLVTGNRTNPVIEIYKERRMNPFGDKISADTAPSIDACS